MCYKWLSLAFIVSHKINDLDFISISHMKGMLRLLLEIKETYRFSSIDMVFYKRPFVFKRTFN